MKIVNVKHNNLYEEIFDIISLDDQIGYFIEEIGEILQAINHYKRGRISYNDLVSEIVDVQITLDTLKIGYKIDQYLFDNIMEEKIQKLNKNLLKLKGDLN